MVAARGVKNDEKQRAGASLALQKPHFFKCFNEKQRYSAPSMLTKHKFSRGFEAFLKSKMRLALALALHYTGHPPFSPTPPFPTILNLIS